MNNLENLKALLAGTEAIKAKMGLTAPRSCANCKYCQKDPGVDYSGEMNPNMLCTANVIAHFSLGRDPSRTVCAVHEAAK